jgi:CRP-like cAMP-binding protein
MPFQQAFAEPALLVAQRDPEASPGRDARALLLVESHALVGGPPPLLQSLTPRERELVLSHGRRRVLNRGQTVFNQGALHEGIFLIESGRIRVFYTAPSGREITLAYWHPGNFVGGPEIFGAGTHLWSGVAATNSTVVQIPGKVLRTLVMQIPTLAIGIIEGLTFKGKCYSALAQMLGTRSITERLAHLLLHLIDIYGVKEPHPDRGGLHPCRSRPHGRRHAAVGHHQPQAVAGAGCGHLPQVQDRRAAARGAAGVA